MSIKPSGKTPGMPFADSRIAQYLTRQIDALQGVKSQREIAFEIGYDKPNLISMFKRGESKVPLDKIPALARSIKVDPAHLFRLALEQYWPGTEASVNEIFGTVVTRNETDILRVIRDATKNEDPCLTPELEKAIRDAIALVVI
jgi:hypothetical protein